MRSERMSGAVPGLSIRNRLRSSDIKEEEEEEEVQTDDEEEDKCNGDKARNKENKMRNDGNKVKRNEKTKTCNGGKTMKKNRENKTRNGDIMKTRRVSTAFFEKQRKKKMLRSHNGEKKMHTATGDHDRGRRGSTSLPSSKDMLQINENKKRIAPSKSHAKVKKMWPGDSMPVKMDICDNREKKIALSLLPKVNNNKNENKRKEPPTPFEKEAKKRAPPHHFRVNKIQTLSNNKNEYKIKEPFSRFKKEKEKEKKKSAPFLLPKGHKTWNLSNNKKENKRKEPPTPFKNKKLQVDNKDKKVWTDDKDKGKKMPGDAANEKVQRVDKENKRKVVPFFKFICNNCKEFLLIPPTITPKLKDLTNRHVYLKDSQGKTSKIRLSVVDGSLAFHDGWANFVSDHFINFGDFLLFEYAGMSTFSVRVFGIDSCERLHFNNKSQGGRNNQIESHSSQDDLDSSHRSQSSEGINDQHYVYGEYPRRKEPKTTVDGYIMNIGKIASCNLVAESRNAASETHGMTANTEVDPSRVVSGIGCHGFSAELDNKNRNLVTGDCKAKSISPTCSKEKTRISETILVTDATPLAQENDGTVKLTILNAASETHHVPVNMKEDPTGVAGGSCCGPSVALDNNLEIAEDKTNSISPTNSNEKTRKSEIIVIYDPARRSMMRESDLEIATPTCMEIHDSDEGLRRKQERNTVQLGCTTVGDKRPYNSKLITDGNVCRKYEAPGGSRCLEKWEKGTMSSRAAFDGSGPTRPEEAEKMDKQLVGSCGATRLNPVEQWLGSESTDSCVQPMPERISKCGHSRTEINHSVNGKGATVQLQTKKEQVEPVGSIVYKQRNNIPECASHAIPRQSEHQFLQQEDDGKDSNCVTAVTLIPRAKVLESENHSLLKINFQFCIPSSTKTWLELPKLLSNAVRQKGRQDRSIIMLKDPMERVWPVFYHENNLLVGFTTGWKPFAEANNLQTGDRCELLKELDEEEPVYRVRITKK